jgi:Fe-S cluster assembly iron-binding protein IscA
VPQASTNGSGPTTIFDFYAADGPEDQDEVVAEQGVQIFLEPEVAPYMNDKLLDAEIDGNEVHFIVEPQDDGDS